MYSFHHHTAPSVQCRPPSDPGVSSFFAAGERTSQTHEEFVSVCSVERSVCTLMPSGFFQPQIRRQADTLQIEYWQVGPACFAARRYFYFGNPQSGTGPGSLMYALRRPHVSKTSKYTTKTLDFIGIRTRDPSIRCLPSTAIYIPLIINRISITAFIVHEHGLQYTAGIFIRRLHRWAISKSAGGGALWAPACFTVNLLGLNAGSHLKALPAKFILRWKYIF